MTHPSTDHAASASPVIHLRILHTSDIHGALRGYDYLADEPSSTFGLCRTATLIRSARATSPNTLLFDTGDVLQGSALCDLTAEQGLSNGAIHPMIAAMNALGYDGFTPGNHDFNHGSTFLFRALEDARFAVVSNNFLHRNPGAGRTEHPVFPPHAALDRRFMDQDGQPHKIRIGITGCLPPQTIDWDHQLAANYTTSDMVFSTRSSIARLRQQHCDLIVLLAHSGISSDPADNCRENAVIDLAALPDVDIVLSGHTHLTFPVYSTTTTRHPAINNAAATIHDTPVLMPGFGGNHLGQADLVLSRDKTNRWHVRSSRQSLLPLVSRDQRGRISRTTPEDAALCDLSAPAHGRTLHYIREPVGETRRPLHSFFSMIANDASVQLVAQAQAEFLRRDIAGTDLASLPILSLAAPFKTGHRSGPNYYTHIPAGPLTRRSINDLYLYPNTFCAVRLTGSQLREWLEHAASVFSHLAPDAAPDTPLLRDSFPGYKFDVILGLTYQIDLRQPPRYDNHVMLADPTSRRVRNLCHDGLPLQDNQEFLVATNSYRVFGIGSPGATADLDPASLVVREYMIQSRDILLDHVRDNGPLDITTQPIWSFTPLGGTTARFQTSPQARAYLDDPTLPPLRDLGDTSEGFAEFQITL